MKKFLFLTLLSAIAACSNNPQAIDANEKTYPCSHDDARKGAC